MWLQVAPLYVTNDPRPVPDDDWSLFLLSEDRCYKLALAEFDDEPFIDLLASGASYHCDIMHAVRLTSLKGDADEKLLTTLNERSQSSDKFFINAVYILLSATQIITFSWTSFPVLFKSWVLLFARFKLNLIEKLKNRFYGIGSIFYNLLTDLSLLRLKGFTVCWCSIRRHGMVWGHFWWSVRALQFVKGNLHWWHFDVDMLGWPCSELTSVRDRVDCWSFQLSSSCFEVISTQLLRTIEWLEISSNGKIS